MKVKITKRTDGMYVVTARKIIAGVPTTVPQAIGRSRALLRKIYVTAGHEVVKTWS